MQMLMINSTAVSVGIQIQPSEAGQVFADNERTFAPSLIRPNRQDWDLLILSQNPCQVVGGCTALCRRKASYLKLSQQVKSLILGNQNQESQNQNQTQSQSQSLNWGSNWDLFNDIKFITRG